MHPAYRRDASCAPRRTERDFAEGATRRTVRSGTPAAKAPARVAYRHARRPGFGETLRRTKGGRGSAPAISIVRVEAGGWSILIAPPSGRVVHSEELPALLAEKLAEVLSPRAIAHRGLQHRLESIGSGQLRRGGNRLREQAERAIALRQL